MALNNYSIDLEAGSTQYLSVADNAALDVISSMTIEMWVKFESVPAEAETMYFCTKYAGAGNRSWLFGVQEDTGTRYIFLNLSADGTAVTVKRVAWTPSTDTWYHVAAVYTDNGADGTVDFYINGAAQGSQQTSAPGSIANSNAALQIGYNSTVGAGLFDGLIDDVRLWSAARTATQILNNYRTEVSGASSNLNGYWKLNNALTDSTANGNTLTNNGAAVFSTTVPFPIQATDTAGTPTESGGYSGGVKVAFAPTLTDTAGTPTESIEVDYGWANTAKTSAPTWSNPAKS